MQIINRYSLPFNKQRVEDLIEAIIYNVIFNQPESETNEDEVKKEFIYLLSKIANKNDTIEIVNIFFNQLNDIRKDLEKLILIFYNNDPASKSELEIILAYPGFFAITVHRLAHLLYSLNTPIFPRIFSEYAHKLTGIDIHPGATIGKNFYIDHGTGIVIGETTIIGDNVKIYQGVTLGAFYVSKNLADKKRHPTIKNNVTIYAGATILGGTTVIGENSTIGGNVWITESIKPNSLVYQEFKPIIKQKKFSNNEDFVI